MLLCVPLVQTDPEPVITEKDLSLQMRIIGNIVSFFIQPTAG